MARAWHEVLRYDLGMRALLLVLCACGGGASATKPAQPTSHDAAQGTITPEVFCDRFLALQQAGCEVFAKMEMTRGQCVGELSKMMSEDGDLHGRVPGL
jgi:hypothetical protein